MSEKEITTGFGIGGFGSDDHNMNLETHPTSQVKSTTGSGKCERCGRPADWNPGAGEFLCERHWDEY